MGLDNGFEVKNINRQAMPSFVYYNKYDEDEIIYWRKCWGLRRVVLNALHAGDEDGIIKVEREDIPAILRGIKPYFHSDYYEENADSIWTYDEFFDNLMSSYMTLVWLYDYWDTHPEIEVEFYDSY